MFSEKKKTINVQNIPAQFLSHLIIHLNILLSEASHGVLTGMMKLWDSLQWDYINSINTGWCGHDERQHSDQNTAIIADLNCDTSLSYDRITIFHLQDWVPGRISSLFGSSQHSFSFLDFLADVRPLHTSPTDIISCLDQPYLTQLKGLGLRNTTEYLAFYFSFKYCWYGWYIKETRLKKTISDCSL